MAANWTKPYHGVQHLGAISDKRWATVTNWGTFAELKKWFRGCGFDPHHETFDTPEQARAAGEAWVERAV